MKAEAPSALVVLAFAVWLFGSGAFASPPPQNKRSKSDADINAIGHRRIVHDENFYSPQKEKELGKTLSQEFERSSKLIEDPVVTDYIERVAQNLANNSDAQFPITVRIIDTDLVNAVTLPGGYQYIDRGLLLQLHGEAELASVLARGIAHTALRSATREATKGELMQLATVPILSGPNSLNAAILLVVLKMRRQNELDADYFGVQYLYKAGYDPKCFTDFVQRIWGANPAMATNVPKPFSTFPPLEERLATLHNEISKILPSKEGAIISTAEFDAFRERLPPAKSGPELKRREEKMEPPAPTPTLKPN
jgi:predicted Zn-dependent protease